MKEKKSFNHKDLLLLLLVGSLSVITFYLGLLYGSSKQGNTNIPVMVTETISK
jgi:hypothetical protein